MLNSINHLLREHRLPSQHSTRLAVRSLETAMTYVYPSWNTGRKQRGSKNFVLMHNARSGSTVLSNLIGQNPKAYCDGEIFLCNYQKIGTNKLKPEDEQMWRWARSRFFPHQPLHYIQSRMLLAGLDKAYGFETKLSDLEGNNLELAQYLDLLEKIDVNYFISLRRRNGLRRIVSRLIAIKTGSYHLRNSAAKPQTKVELPLNHVRFDCRPTSLLESLSLDESFFTNLENLLENRQHLCLTYEDDIAPSPERAYQKCCEFLGLPAHAGKVKFVKINSSSLRELISNYDEVQAYLSPTRFAWMLED